MTGECCLSRKPEVILLLSAAATRSPFALCIGFFFFARGGRFGHGEQAAPDFGVAAATPRGGRFDQGAQAAPDFGVAAATPNLRGGRFDQGARAAPDFGVAAATPKLLERPVWPRFDW